MWKKKEEQNSKNEENNHVNKNVKKKCGYQKLHAQKGRGRAGSEDQGRGGHQKTQWDETEEREGKGAQRQKTQSEIKKEKDERDARERKKDAIGVEKGREKKKNVVQGMWE